MKKRAASSSRKGRAKSELAAEERQQGPEPSRQALDELPHRVLRFLRGVSTSNDVAKVLARRGYGAAEHAEGWRLLGESFPHVPPVHDDYGETTAALVALDEWYATMGRVVRAAVRARFADYEDTLFGEDSLGKRGGSVRAEWLLDELDGLERKSGMKAMFELLASRGLTRDERARVRSLVRASRVAKRIDPKADNARTQSLAAARESLLRLSRYYAEWAEIARTDIRRRDLLVRIGLAERQRAKAPVAS